MIKNFLLILLYFLLVFFLILGIYFVIIFPKEDHFALNFPIEKKWHFPKIDRKRPDYYLIQ